MKRVKWPQPKWRLNYDKANYGTAYSALGLALHGAGDDQVLFLVKLMSVVVSSDDIMASLVDFFPSFFSEVLALGIGKAQSSHWGCHAFKRPSSSPSSSRHYYNHHPHQQNQIKRITGRSRKKDKMRRYEDIATCSAFLQPSIYKTRKV